MPFTDLTDAQRRFLSSHTKSGKALAQSAQLTKPDPLEAERTKWLATAGKLMDQIKAAPPALDTTKLINALEKTERIFEADFESGKANKALKTILAAFTKAMAATAGNTVDTGVRLKAAQSEFAALQKLAFPEKKPISAKISDLFERAQSEINKGEFGDAERLIDAADATMAAARIGVDAKAAKDLKPADLKVLMKTKDGRAQLDAIVDNLTDDVPPNVMMSILEARFSIDRRLFTNTSDRESSMLDKAKHGAMLDTDSPKLKKFYKKLMDKKSAEEKQAK